MGTIVAIGGYLGERKDYFNTPTIIDKEIVELAGKKKPRVLFVPTASSDSESYVEAFIELYGRNLNCEVDILKLIKEKPEKHEIESKILGSDIIYVGGGNTLKMMNKWRSMGVDKIFQKAYEKGIVLCGVSAGSICWFEYGISDSRQFKNPKSKEYIRVSGLGFIRAVNNPHYGSKKHDKGHRTKGMKNIMKRTKGVCFAVPDACALKFTEGKFEIIKGLKDSKVFEAFWEKGSYILRELQ